MLDVGTEALENENAIFSLSALIYEKENIDNGNIVLDADSTGNAETLNIGAAIGNTTTNEAQIAHGLTIKKTTGNTKVINLNGSLSNFDAPGKELIITGSKATVIFAGEHSFPPANVNVTDGASAYLEQDITIVTDKTLKVENGSTLGITVNKTITVASNSVLELQSGSSGAFYGPVILQDGATLVIGNSSQA
jgi:hypothetical protein